MFFLYFFNFYTNCLPVKLLAIPRAAQILSFKLAGKDVIKEEEKETRSLKQSYQVANGEHRAVIAPVFMMQMEGYGTLLLLKIYIHI